MAKTPDFVENKAFFSVIKFKHPNCDSIKVKDSVRVLDNADLSTTN